MRQACYPKLPIFQSAQMGALRGSHAPRTNKVSKKEDCMKCYLKNGMGGSRCGKGRYEKTEVLKRWSKKLRRVEGKKIISRELQK
ncbi:MAG: hypothetical protein WCF93_02770 [Candidatus Moraniibacteriota bacterium]